MSNWGWVLSAAVAVSVLTGGCASTSGSAVEEKKPRPEIMSGEGREEAKKLAEEYVAGFVAALKENKFDKLKAVIPENSKTKVTPEMFEQMNKELTETMGQLIKA